MRLLCTILWKEWLGLRWKLAALIGIWVGTMLGLLVYDPAAIEMSQMLFMIGFIAIAPIFLAMHAATEDQSSGTLEFVRGLPIPLWQWGLVRVLATLAVLLTPFVVSAASACGLFTAMSWWDPTWHADRFDSSQSFGLEITLRTGEFMAVAASLFLWTTALAMNQPSELRAGLIGVGTAVAWGAWTNFSLAVRNMGYGSWTSLFAITGLGPFAVVVLHANLTVGASTAIGIGQLVAAVLLVIVAANRYGVLDPPKWFTGWRLASPARALWWMQWQESWPLGATGLGIVVALVVVGLVGNNGAGHGPFFQGELYNVSTIIGGAWAIVSAVTMFCVDLEPRLLAFWRSRPIDPVAWFRIKFVTGALITLIFVDLPAAWFGAIPYDPEAAIFAGYIACVPALHLAIYSLAVLVACLVRHVTYAGILSMGATLFVVVIPMMPGKSLNPSRINVFEVMKHFSYSIAYHHQLQTALPSLAIYLAYVLSIAAAATFAARWAVQKDFAVRT